MPRPSGKVRPREGREAGRINRLLVALRHLIVSAEPFAGNWSVIDVHELQSALRAARAAVAEEEHVERPR